MTALVITAQSFHRDPEHHALGTAILAKAGRDPDLVDLITVEAGIATLRSLNPAWLEPGASPTAAMHSPTTALDWSDEETAAVLRGPR